MSISISRLNASRIYMSAAYRLVLSVLLFCFTTHAVANDSTARIGVGGLVFLKNDDIRMASEALSVSPKRINVRYRFRNGRILNRSAQRRGAVEIVALRGFASSGRVWGGG